MIPPSPAPARDDRTIVVALGGNALQPEGERGDIHEQFRHTRESLGAIVELAGRGWRIAIVHGNGPQIGDELLRTELARSELPSLPLGVLVAATAGWIGYMIQQSLQNALERADVRRSVVTLITQVLVDPDQARAEPTKPIGRPMDERRAQLLAREEGWVVGPAGDRWRRLVPSPVPLGIVEAADIRSLVEKDVIVIAAGGGGTPVYRDRVLRLEGVDAVIDKDRAAEVLAAEIGAAVLLILTNVDGVYRAFGTPQAELIRELPANDAARMLEAGEFGAGSMGPKVEAALAFLRRGGTRAVIGRLDQGLRAVQGEAGTRIVP
ncbi:MAG TPA: carbamate kinase [Longimicrobiales bacterium]